MRAGGPITQTPLFILSVNFLHTQLFHSIIKDKKKRKGFPKKQIEIFLKNFMNIAKSTLKLIQT